MQLRTSGGLDTKILLYVEGKGFFSSLRTRGLCLGVVVVPW
jgi:hypothetical protein